MCVVGFIAIICYRVKVIGSFTILEEQGSKRLCACIAVYFHLSASITIVYFKHGFRYHMIFLFIKYMLALVLLHILLFFFHVNLCKGLAIALKFCINFWKYCTKPRNSYNFLTMVGTGHLFKLYTLKSLICILWE